MIASAERMATAPDRTFERILCATDLSEAGTEAVRQATILAGRETALELVSVPGEERGTDLAAAVLQRWNRHDLLVTPAGAQALACLPRLPTPILLSRPGPVGASFPENILVAVDGSPEAHDAVRLGARIAARHEALLTLVATPEHDGEHRRALRDDVAL